MIYLIIYFTSLSIFLWWNKLTRNYTCWRTTTSHLSLSCRWCYWCYCFLHSHLTNTGPCFLSCKLLLRCYWTYIRLLIWGRWRLFYCYSLWLWLLCWCWRNSWLLSWWWWNDCCRFWICLQRLIACSSFNRGWVWNVWIDRFGRS